MAKASKKATEKRVSKIYGHRCHGVQISIWDMAKVMEVGVDACEAGLDDQGVGDRIHEYVESIRKN